MIKSKTSVMELRLDKNKVDLTNLDDISRGPRLRNISRNMSTPAR